jgi:hypothetical protein
MVKYEKGKANYEMNVDLANKVLHLKAFGFFGEEDGQSFLNDYDKIVKTIPAAEYSLIINVPDLKPSGNKVVDMLGTLLERYMRVPFKKRFLVTKGDAITIMQFKRLGAGVPGWSTGVEYVNDYETALLKAKK